MKKSVLMMLTVVFVLMLAACGGKKVDDATAEKYVTQAEEVVLLLSERNYEEVHTRFNEEMKTGLPIDEMENLTPIFEEAGSFEEISKASVEENDGYYVTVLVAKHSNKKLVYTISFNNDDEIVGLYIK